jgi:hypothetical protein
MFPGGTLELVAQHTEQVPAGGVVLGEVDDDTGCTQVQRDGRHDVAQLTRLAGPQPVVQEDRFSCRSTAGGEHVAVQSRPVVVLEQQP